jgi:alpha-galactosidase
MEPIDAHEQQPENSSPNPTRRSFLRTGAAGIGALAAASSNLAPKVQAQTPASPSARPSSFLDLLRVPDGVTAFESFQQTLPAGATRLQRRGEQWTGGQIEVESRVERDALALALQSPSTPVVLVHVRWQFEISEKLKVLGDAWERSYGELGWRNLIPERVMPWYFATFDSASCHSYGVKTDARALCFWQLDPQGVSLWLNVANGGNGVELGQRSLTMATVVTRRGAQGEPAFDSVTALCKAMCTRPRVSVIFWPPCLGSGEGSSSTCGGHVATEGLGWMKG